MTISLVAALGSSFAAGPTLEPVEDAAAQRSGDNYPHLLARALGADLVDLTVSGATTSTVLSESQTTMSGTRFPPQVDGLPVEADLVTITAGGNDLQLVGSLLFAAFRHVAPGSPVAQMIAPMFPDGLQEPTREGVTAAADGLVAVVDAVRGRAPGARVLLVDYLTILDAGADAGGVGIGADDLPLLRRVQAGLEQAHVMAAERSGAELVRVSAASRGHGVGAVDPWVMGFVPDPEKIFGSFHPSADGMRHVADLVLDAVR